MASETTESVRGVWQRQFEEDPLGDSENADRDTLVFWTQAPQSGIYVDIRLPKGSLGRSDTARRNGIEKDPTALQARGMNLPNLSPEDLSILLRQKSFAGILQFSMGDNTNSKQAVAKDQILADLAKAATTNPSAMPLCTCFWKRHIDYQPPSGRLDIAVCASAPPNADGSADLRETGDDASYAEGWHRLSGSAQGPYWAFQLLTEDGLPRSGYWARTGKYFAYAIGRPQDTVTAKQLGCTATSARVQGCVGKSLDVAVQGLLGDDSDNAPSTESILPLIGTYVCVFGEVVAPSGATERTTRWKILHSTDPRLVGCELFGSAPDSCSTINSEKDSNHPIQEGDVLCQTVVLGGCVRRWKVVEVDDVSVMRNELPGFF